jgi:hypothetical protein
MKAKRFLWSVAYVLIWAVLGVATLWAAAALYQPPADEDGVVKYTSAHVDYAESKFIVRSGHSAQGNPLTIEEVRRILLANLGEANKVK